MKRIICLLFALFLLSGCAGPGQDHTDPTMETQPPVTEPPVPWVEEFGMPWDREGVLTELMLTIPDGLHYSSCVAFDGDLLLWCVDSHLAEEHTLEMCLIELDNGTISAERSISFPESVTPQVLGDSIYLCDSFSGQILQLDKTLQTVNSWSAEAVEGSWYMDGKQCLYIYNWDGSVQAVNLASGESTDLFEGGPYVSFFNVIGDYATVEYYSPDTSEKVVAILDLLNGGCYYQPIRGKFDSLACVGGTWLCDSYGDGYTSYVGSEAGGFVYAELGYDTLQLLDSKTLLCTKEDGCILSLHRLTGESIAQCVLTENPYSVQCSAVIPSEAFGGYFLVTTDYNSSIRLLYWDTGSGSRGEPIPFTPVPEPSAEEAQVRQRVEELQSRYGVAIFIGADCRTDFYDYTAETVTDWASISEALDTLERALSVYPEGFFHQLRYGSIHALEIHLAGSLQPYDAGEYVDTYSAFVQEEHDKFVMAADINLTYDYTYFHEISHVIDAYLAWDAENRTDALFSEDTWCSLNPSWFPGYTYTYSQEVALEDMTSFVDSYSTIKPTEDRARVLEYAMAEFGYYTFEDADILLKKLDYYCRCIRDAFDTAGWEEPLPWEQYLYLNS